MPMVGTLSGNQSSQSFASPLPNSCSHGHWHRVSVGSETGNQRRTLQLRRGNVAAFKINSATHSLWFFEREECRGKVNPWNGLSKKLGAMSSNCPGTVCLDKNSYNQGEP